MMKYKLNKLPVKTTNNFKVNDLEIDLEMPKISSFKDFSITGDTDKVKIDMCTKIEEIKTRIGLSFEKYLDVHITIPRNVTIKKPIIFTYDFMEDDVLIDKMTFDYEENAQADFIFIYKSVDEKKHFHSLLDVSCLKGNSQGNITFINLMNNNSYNFMAFENECLDNSYVTNNVIDLGGRVRVYNSLTSLVGVSSRHDLNHIYIGKDEEIIDINYYLKNIGSESISKMNVQGAIDDKCHKTFRGTIDFINGCTNSCGDENENCVLLSDTCRSRSLPQMLCEEENVMGSHGVSSGKVSLDKLFYLMSRGLSKKDAERLIVLANFSSILNAIPQDNIREMILDRIEEKLS